MYNVYVKNTPIFVDMQMHSYIYIWAQLLRLYAGKAMSMQAISTYIFSVIKNCKTKFVFSYLLNNTLALVQNKYLTTAASNSTAKTIPIPITLCNTK